MTDLVTRQTITEELDTTIETDLDDGAKIELFCGSDSACLFKVYPPEGGDPVCHLIRNGIGDEGGMVIANPTGSIRFVITPEKPSEIQVRAI